MTGPGRPLRVLVVIDSLGAGGAEGLLIPFVTGAAAEGIAVSVVSLNSPEDRRTEMVAPLQALGVRPVFLGIPRLLWPKALPVIARQVATSGCDVVHAHLEYAATLVPPAAWLAGRPTVCTFHHVPHELSWRAALRERLAVAVASRSQRAMFVSAASFDEFSRRYGAARPSWTVVPNGVDLSTFAPSPASFPADIGIPPGAPTVVLPAALRAPKGHGLMLRAWPAVIAAVPSARLVFAGSGPEEAGLRQLARSLGVGDSVVFAGFRRDIPRLLQAAAVVVLPSETEALPTVLMEAAACGRPVVASRVGGIPEVVADGLTGVLVPPGDAGAFSHALAGLLSDGDRRNDLGLAARRHAEASFGVGTWLRRLRVIYDDATLSFTASRCPPATRWGRGASGRGGDGRPDGGQPPVLLPPNRSKG